MTILVYCNDALKKKKDEKYDKSLMKTEMNNGNYERIANKNESNKQKRNKMK